MTLVSAPAHQKTKMDQLLSTFGINWKLLLAQSINFGLLLVILWHFLYKPLLRIIAERQSKIAEGVRTAEEAELKLSEAKAKGEEIVGGAAREAESLLSSARVHAEEKGQEIVHAAEARAAASLKDAQMKADEAKRQALEASRQEIARAAMLAAEKILREQSA